MPLHVFLGDLDVVLRDLFPTPREPECRNSQIWSVSSAVTSMKWLPEPRVPSCRRQFPAYWSGANGMWAAAARNSRSSM